MRGSQRRSVDALTLQLPGIPRHFVVFNRYLLLWQDGLAAFRQLAEMDTEAP